MKIAYLGCALASIMSVAHAQLSPEMKKLDWFVGTYSGDLTMPDGKGGSNVIKYSWRGEVSGAFIKVLATSEASGMKFTDTIYFGYDPIKKSYWSHAYPSYGQNPRIEKGEVVDNKATFVSEPWQNAPNGPVMEMRWSMTRHSASSMGFILEAKTGGKFVQTGSATLKKPPIKLAPK